MKTAAKKKRKKENHPYLLEKLTIITFHVNFAGTQELLRKVSFTI